ncbi:MAG: endonuclease III [Candidatus Limnocylindrales bacterium]
MAITRTITRPAARKPAPRKRAKPDPAKAWARKLARTRPALMPWVLEQLDAHHGTPVWARVHDPTSELILTILTQNTADVNAEHAFDLLRTTYPSSPEHRTSALGEGSIVTRPGWGGKGWQDTGAPDWQAVEDAPLDELIEVIRPGGLGPQKAPRIQAALRRIREERGDHSLEFLGEMSAREARDWLTSIPGIGRKTASVVLLFSFGMPLMPVDRHIERVALRIGLLPPKVSADVAHEMFLEMLEADQMYPAHVGLITHGRRICHAQRPECDRCPLAPRCRYVDPKAA